MVIKIGLIGTGSIAEYLLEELNKKAHDPVKIVVALVRNKAKYEHLKEKYNIEITEDINRLLESGIDLVVEEANVSAVKQRLPKIVEHKDRINISVGAFSEYAFVIDINIIHTVSIAYI